MTEDQFESLKMQRYLLDLWLTRDYRSRFHPVMIEWRRRLKAVDEAIQAEEARRTLAQAC